jgi:hypothetical protein
MIRFFILAVFYVLVLVNTAYAQTPEQLEMLKQKEKPINRIYPELTYKDEETGKYVIPESMSDKKITLADGQVVPAPLEKTDEEIKATKYGPNHFFVRDMTDEELKQYLTYVVQDRIILRTSDFKVYTTASGMKLCQLRAHVLNLTSHNLKKLHLMFSWGDLSTPATFENVGALQNDTQDTAFSGSACDLLEKGPKYNISECVMDGLTKQQCLIRILEQ